MNGAIGLENDGQNSNLRVFYTKNALNPIHLAVITTEGTRSKYLNIKKNNWLQTAKQNQKFIDGTCRRPLQIESKFVNAFQEMLVQLKYKKKLCRGLNGRDVNVHLMKYRPQLTKYQPAW